MSRRLRLAAVSFLNARPITYGIERGLVGADRFDLSFAEPSRCAAAVATGEADLGLMPVASYAASTEELRVVPGIAIASRGPVRTVLLAGHVPWEAMTSIALDGASRTSQMLVRLLSKQRGLRPDTIEVPHDEIVEAASGTQGTLIIGDLGLQIDGRFPHVYDLGQEWHRLVRLPFVYAVWAGRPGVTSPQDVALLHESLRLGLQARVDIGRAWAQENGVDPAVGKRYLLENIHYALGSDEISGATAGSWLLRVNGVDFARVASVVAWPTRQPSVWITFSPVCLPGNTYSRYPMPCASRWPIRPTPRPWCLAHSSAPSTPTSAVAQGSESFVADCRPEA